MKRQRRSSWTISPSQLVVPLQGIGAANMPKDAPWSTQDVSVYMSNTKHTYEDPRSCALCQGRQDEALGRLMPIPSDLRSPLAGDWLHISCALWSSEVYIYNNILYNVSKARNRGARTVPNTATVCVSR